MPLVDKRQSGDLLARVRGVRRKLSQDLGFLVPAVHIRDNLDLAPNVYRINLGGVPVGESMIYPERDLAINPGRVATRRQLLVPFDQGRLRARRRAAVLPAFDGHDAADLAANGATPVVVTAAPLRSVIRSSRTISGAP